MNGLVYEDAKVKGESDPRIAKELDRGVITMVIGDATYVKNIHTHEQTILKNDPKKEDEENGNTPKGKPQITKEDLTNNAFKKNLEKTNLSNAQFSEVASNKSTED